MDNLFIQFSLVLTVATAFAIVLRFLKQPLIIAYIATGLILSIFGFIDVRSSETLQFLPEIGLALLLFMVGMELDLRELRSVGKEVVFVAVSQILLTFFVGFDLVSLLGFSPIHALYLALGLSFSSTILVVKLLVERGMITSLSGKLAVGLLLLEDVVAISVLMVLSAFGAEGRVPNAYEVLIIIGKGVGFIGTAWLLSKRFLPAIFELVAVSGELLFISTVSWVLLFVSFALWIGFSPNIGAFLAGLSLASSPYRFQMAGKLKLLRDLFIALFFIKVGTETNMAVVGQLVPSVLVLMVFVLVWKPLLFLFLLLQAGFRKHTVFTTSLSLTQTSEFSLILASVGLSLGHLTSVEVSVMSLVTMGTMAISSYLILASPGWYHFFLPLLSRFETKHHQDTVGESVREWKDHVLLCGCDAMGHFILEELKKSNKTVLTLDFNPDVVRELKQNGFDARYGDMTDPEVLEGAQAESAKLIISTVPSRQDSIQLLKELSALGAKAPVIVTASHAQEALELYGLGAAFVIMPRVLGGKYVGDLLEKHFDHWDDLAHIRQEHVEELSVEHQKSHYIFDQA